MAKFSTTNPLLSEERISNIEQNEAFNGAVSRSESGVMTLQGTARKTLFLVVLTIATTLITMSTMSVESYSYGGTLIAMFAGAIVLFILGRAVSLGFVLAPIYAICEGYVLGALSIIFEAKYPGVATQAALITAIDAGVMFFGFSFGIFRVNQTFKNVIICATLALAVFYFASIIFQLFAHNPIFAFGSGISILINVVAVVVASCCLLLDFDNIASAHGRVSKGYEWYFGASLLASLIWMYVEILRLLAQLQSRD